MKRGKIKLARISNERGQSAIEFIICVVVIFFFLLFYLSLSILLVTSNYLDYATFMAARTYKSGYDTKDTKLANAQKVFQSYASKVQGIAININNGNALPPPIQTDPNDPQTTGFIVNYDINLFYLPPVFVPGNMPSRITLFSEAHLGSDPGLEDCSNYFGTFSQKNGLNLDQALLQEMDDNGC